jgi:hypothetical protein
MGQPQKDVVRPAVKDMAVFAGVLNFRAKLARIGKHIVNTFKVIDNRTGLR